MNCPIICSRAAGGQSAFLEGVVQALGFTAIPVDELEAHLKTGAPVLLNGWWPEFEACIDKYPGQGFVVWHSSWCASDLMNEGALLRACLERLRTGVVHVFWLDAGDVMPQGAERLRPVWSPASLREIVDPRPPKRHGEVVVGLHGPYPSGVKNPLAAIVASLAAGATVHVGQTTLMGVRGNAFVEILRSQPHVVHTPMSRMETAKLLASVDLLVHPSLAETWPYMPMESVYSGTPVVISPAIPWELPSWARDLCVAEPKSTLEISSKVRHLLEDERDRERLLAAQESYLDATASQNAVEAARTLSAAGFRVKVRETRAITRRKPKVLLTCDVPEWAFDVNLKDLAEYLKDDFDFEFWYVVGGKPLSCDGYDLIYVPYHRWSQLATLDYSKAVGALRSWWFTAEKPGPASDVDVALVNRYRAFHVVTKHNYDEIKDCCPRLSYLTNPVNTRRFVHVIPPKGPVVAAWNGNAKHCHAGGLDVKGLWSIIKPACDKANVPLELAEYHTSRVPPSEMPQFYAKASVSICASLYEGASNSIMEAMASGHAILSTDVGNIQELRLSQLENYGNTGIRIIERSEESIVDALWDLKRRPGVIHQMGKLNKCEIAARWSWSTWADRYKAFLRKSL